MAIQAGDGTVTTSHTTTHALIESAWSGDVSLLESALRAGADVNARCVVMADRL
jgi:hypothetical protein